MWQNLRQRIRNLTLAQSFMLSSLLILVAGMALIAIWVEQQIESGVVHRTAATTALYVDSFITPNLQELASGSSLTPEHKANLDRLLEQTTFGQKIAVFKVWSRDGRIVYSDDSTLIGQRYPVEAELAESLSGRVTADISDLSKAENAHERQTQPEGLLLEMYSPVRLNGSDEVIGAAEFYYTVDELNAEIASAQLRTWAVVGAATLVMYLLLSGFVRRASSTISRQRATLSTQVQQQAALLVENEELNERVRRAAARTTALNERYLRRISAELHDGPAQDIGLALLRLDHVMARSDPRATSSTVAGTSGPAPDGGLVSENESDLEAIDASLRRAMQEIRSISSGLGVPHLETWTLTETLSRVISSHERQSGTKVAVVRDYSREEVPLPVKITVYRLVQEALRNAYRHCGDCGQQVTARITGETLWIEVADNGPGFDPTAPAGPTTGAGERLGLVGMRERVESIGGLFRVDSAPGKGTRIQAELPLAVEEEGK